MSLILTELDHHDARKSGLRDQYRRPDMIASDPAMLLPGGLDKLLYVDLPSAGEWAEIFMIGSLLCGTSRQHERCIWIITRLNQGTCGWGTMGMGNDGTVLVRQH